MSKKVWIAIGALALCAIVGYVMISGGDETPDVTVTTAVPAGQEVVAPAEATTEAEEPAAVVAKPGDTVTVGDIAWVVNNVTDHGGTIDSGSDYTEDLTSTGRLIRVTYDITNNGADAVDTMDPKLVDSENREFSPVEEWYSYVPEDAQCIGETINPGMTKTCEWVYEIPTAATSIRARVTELAIFGSNTADIDLGIG